MGLSQSGMRTPRDVGALLDALTGCALDIGCIVRHARRHLSLASYAARTARPITAAELASLERAEELAEALRAELDRAHTIRRLGGSLTDPKGGERP